MTFSVRVVDAPHRPEVYAEIEREDRLVAEVFVEAGQVRVAAVNLDGERLWEDSLDAWLEALASAKQALAEMGLP